MKLPSPFGTQRDMDRLAWLSPRSTQRDTFLWPLLRFVVFGLAIMLVLSSILYFTWQSNVLSLMPGQIANRTIKAPRTATFVSESRTAESRQEAYDDVRNIVYWTDPSIAPSQVSALETALDEIDEVRAEQPANGTADVERIRAAVEGLTEADAQAIARLSASSWQRVSNEASRLLNDALREEVAQEEVAVVKEGLYDRTVASLSVNERILTVALVRPFVRSTIQVDEAQTQAAREEASRNVEPVLVTVQQGQAIVRDGDPVTRYDIEKLEYFDFLTPAENWQQFMGLLGLLGFLTLALSVYLYKFAHGLWQHRQLLLVGLVMILPIVAGRFLLQNEDLQYMFPAAAAIMLLTILVEFRVAVVCAGFLALYLGIVAGTSFDVTFVSFLTSVAGAAIIWRAERTVTFLWSGFGVTVAAFVSAACFSLLDGNLSMVGVGSLLIDASVNGALSASLTFLFFSLLGRLFGITTHLQLLELAHPNQPLLYRLAREAPGTYHHSIVVSNLSESAVEQVGGDPLFARVAVLYHDIGKVLRPSFFVENQANRANVHDALDPRTSARIIQEHVTDGVRLAKKARLPQSIIDIIEQHHGTTLIKYFYTQALNNGEDVDESEFRYDGPRPQTKEAGIVMLADSVEAAVRASSQSGKLYEESQGTNGAGARRATRLHDIVDGVIRARLEDGQLDECDLTLKQIELVRQTFISILEGIYHPRVEYPEVRRPASAPSSTTETQPLEVTP